MKRRMKDKKGRFLQGRWKGKGTPRSPQEAPVVRLPPGVERRGEKRRERREKREERVERKERREKREERVESRE